MLISVEKAQSIIRASERCKTVDEAIDFFTPNEARLEFDFDRVQRQWWAAVQNAFQASGPRMQQILTDLIHTELLKIQKRVTEELLKAQEE